MRRFKNASIFAMILACAASVAAADVNTVVEHNTGDKANSDFKFAKIASPTKTDNAAIKAKVTIVDGEKDDNSAEATALNDGTLPSQEDQPDANFFFKDGTDGGRIQIDLGATMNVSAINTYSWHPSTRAPQVYKLYVADGTDPKFNAAPKAGTKPTDCGWKLIATVDTRPKDGDVGGQYAVSTTDSGGSLGSYRYVLLETSKTESDDDFCNTFMSEINVIAK